MEIIDICISQQKIQSLIQSTLNQVKLSISNQFKSIISIFTSSQLNFQIILNRISHFLLIAKIQLIDLKQLNIYVSVIDNTQLQVQYNVDKSILIREFLKTNNKLENSSLLINPQNGNFCLSFFVSIQAIDPKISEFMQILTTIFENLKDQSSNLFLDIVNILQKNTVLPKQNRFQKTTANLKRCIKTAPFYAWDMLRTITLSKKQKLKFGYLTMRNEFVDKQKKYQQNYYIDQISKALNNNDINACKIMPFENFTLEEQRAIKQNYLPLLNFNKKSKLINEINLSEENIRKLLKQKLCQITCHQLGNINVLLTVFPNTQTHALNYEKEILAKLPNNQYMGLAKYYFVKNYSELTKNCIITNLHSGFIYYRYLEKNETTISIYTKFHLLHQLLLVLKYINKYGIVYHNLQPKNLMIKKGLYLKISNFTNAYHSEMDIINIKKFYQPYQTILPYISNYQNYINESYGDQKSDIFSFGMILYQTLYGEIPFHAKKNKFRELEQVKILLKPPLVTLQKQSKILKQLLKILTYASLECVNHNKLYRQTENDEDNINKQITIKNRPHVQWLIVVIKWISQLCQQGLF